MTYLIDTHTFLWFILGDSKLSAVAYGLMRDPENDIIISPASIWEMAIKIGLKKLDIFQPFDPFVTNELATNSIGLMQIVPQHVAILTTLPLHHKDPFDRLIIAQSLHESLPVIGCDTAFDSYGVPRFW